MNDVIWFQTLETARSHCRKDFAQMRKLSCDNRHLTPSSASSGTASAANDLQNMAEDLDQQ